MSVASNGERRTTVYFVGPEETEGTVWASQGVRIFPERDGPAQAQIGADFLAPGSAKDDALR